MRVTRVSWQDPITQHLWQQFKLSLPASLQQLFFSAGLVTLMWIVSQIGTAEVAAVNVLMTFHITAVLPAFGLALAATTLVGNALGRGDVEDAVLWGWNAAAISLVYGVVLSLVLIPFADPLLGVFLTNPETRQLAYWPMILWALVIGFDTTGMVLMNALIGAGDTRRSMWISVIAQWVFFSAVRLYRRTGAGLRPDGNLGRKQYLPHRAGRRLCAKLGRKTLGWNQALSRFSLPNNGKADTLRLRKINPNQIT